MTASEKHAAEFERMSMLEHRMNHLEKQCHKEPTTFIGGVCQAFWDLVRSIPFCSVLWICPSLSGLYIMIKYSHEVANAVRMLQLGTKAEELTADLLPVCIFIMVVDVMVCLSSFAATGATREWVFGRDHQGCMMFVACMVGPCSLALLMALLVVCFLLLFVSMLVLVPTTTLFALAAGSCEDHQASTVQGLASIFASMMGSPEARMEKALQGVCAGNSDTLTLAGAAFTSGVAMATFGQVGQLVTHMNNWEKVMMQKDLEDKGEKELLNDYFKTHKYKAREV